MLQLFQNSEAQEKETHLLSVLLLVLSSAVVLFCTCFELGFLGTVLLLLAAGAAGCSAYSTKRCYLALLISIPALAFVLLTRDNPSAVFTALLTPLAAFLLSFLYKKGVSRTWICVALTVLFAVMNTAQLFSNVYLVFGSVTKQTFVELYGMVKTDLLSVTEAGNLEEVLGITSASLDQLMVSIVYLLPGILVIFNAASALLSDLFFHLFCRVDQRAQNLSECSKFHSVSIVTAVIYLVLSILCFFLSADNAIGTAAMNLYMVIMPFLFACGCRTYFRRQQTDRLNVPALILSVFLLFFNPLWLVLLISLSGAVSTVSVAVQNRQNSNKQ